MKIQYYIVLFGLLYLSFIVGHNIGFERGVSKESSECKQQLNELMGRMSNVCNTSPSTDEENIHLPYVNVSGTFISGFNSSVNGVWYNTTNASYENACVTAGWHNITITK